MTKQEQSTAVGSITLTMAYAIAWTFGEIEFS